MVVEKDTKVSEFAKKIQNIYQLLESDPDYQAEGDKTREQVLLDESVQRATQHERNVQALSLLNDFISKAGSSKAKPAKNPMIRHSPIDSLLQRLQEMATGAAIEGAYEDIIGIDVLVLSKILPEDEMEVLEDYAQSLRYVLVQEKLLSDALSGNLDLQERMKSNGIKLWEHDLSSEFVEGMTLDEWDKTLRGFGLNPKHPMFVGNPNDTRLLNGNKMDAISYASDYLKQIELPEDWRDTLQNEFSEAQHIRNRYTAVNLGDDDLMPEEQKRGYGQASRARNKETKRILEAYKIKYGNNLIPDENSSLAHKEEFTNLTTNYQYNNTDFVLDILDEARKAGQIEAPDLDSVRNNFDNLDVADRHRVNAIIADAVNHSGMDDIFSIARNIVRNSGVILETEKRDVSDQNTYKSLEDINIDAGEVTSDHIRNLVRELREVEGIEDVYITGPSAEKMSAGEALTAEDMLHIGFVYSEPTEQRNMTIDTDGLVYKTVIGPMEDYVIEAGEGKGQVRPGNNFQIINPQTQEIISSDEIDAMSLPDLRAEIEEESIQFTYEDINGNRQIVPDEVNWFLLRGEDDAENNVIDGINQRIAVVETQSKRGQRRWIPTRGRDTTKAYSVKVRDDSRIERDNTSLERHVQNQIQEILTTDEGVEEGIILSGRRRVHNGENWNSEQGRYEFDHGNGKTRIGIAPLDFRFGYDKEGEIVPHSLTREEKVSHDIQYGGLLTDAEGNIEMPNKLLDRIGTLPEAKKLNPFGQDMPRTSGLAINLDDYGTVKDLMDAGIITLDDVEHIPSEDYIEDMVKQHMDRQDPRIQNRIDTGNDQPKNILEQAIQKTVQMIVDMPKGESIAQKNAAADKKESLKRRIDILRGLQGGYGLPEIMPKVGIEYEDQFFGDEGQFIQEPYKFGDDLDEEGYNAIVAATSLSSRADSEGNLDFTFIPTSGGIFIDTNGNETDDPNQAAEEEMPISGEPAGRYLEGDKWVTTPSTEETQMVKKIARNPDGSRKYKRHDNNGEWSDDQIIVGRRGIQEQITAERERISNQFRDEIHPADSEVRKNIVITDPNNPDKPYILGTLIADDIDKPTTYSFYETRYDIESGTDIPEGPPIQGNLNIGELDNLKKSDFFDLNEEVGAVQPLTEQQKLYRSILAQANPAALQDIVETLRHYATLPVDAYRSKHTSETGAGWIGDFMKNFLNESQAVTDYREQIQEVKQAKDLTTIEEWNELHSNPAYTKLNFIQDRWAGERKAALDKAFGVPKTTKAVQNRQAKGLPLRPQDYEVEPQEVPEFFQIPGFTGEELELYQQAHPDVVTRHDSAKDQLAPLRDVQAMIGMWAYQMAWEKNATSHQLADARYTEGSPVYDYLMQVQEATGEHWNGYQPYQIQEILEDLTDILNSKDIEAYGVGSTLGNLQKRLKRINSVVKTKVTKDPESARLRFGGGDTDRSEDKDYKEPFLEPIISDIKQAGRQAQTSFSGKIQPMTAADKRQLDHPVYKDIPISAFKRTSGNKGGQTTDLRRLIKEFIYPDYPKLLAMSKRLGYSADAPVKQMLLDMRMFVEMTEEDGSTYLTTLNPERVQEGIRAITQRWSPQGIGIERVGEIYEDDPNYPGLEGVEESEKRAVATNNTLEIVNVDGKPQLRKVTHKLGRNNEWVSDIPLEQPATFNVDAMAANAKHQEKIARAGINFPKYENTFVTADYDDTQWDIVDLINHFKDGLAGDEISTDWIVGPESLEELLSTEGLKKTSSAIVALAQVFDRNPQQYKEELQTLNKVLRTLNRIDAHSIADTNIHEAADMYHQEDQDFTIVGQVTQQQYETALEKEILNGTPESNLIQTKAYILGHKKLIEKAVDTHIAANSADEELKLRRSELISANINMMLNEELRKVATNNIDILSNWDQYRFTDGKRHGDYTMTDDHWRRVMGSDLEEGEGRIDFNYHPKEGMWRVESPVPLNWSERLEINTEDTEEEIAERAKQRQLLAFSRWIGPEYWPGEPREEGKILPPEGVKVEEPTEESEPYGERIFKGDGFFSFLPADDIGSRTLKEGIEYHDKFFGEDGKPTHIVIRGSSIPSGEYATATSVSHMIQQEDGTWTVWRGGDIDSKSGQVLLGASPLLEGLETAMAYRVGRGQAVWNSNTNTFDMLKMVGDKTGEGKPVGTAIVTTSSDNEGAVVNHAGLELLGIKSKTARAAILGYAEEHGLGKSEIQDFLDGIENPDIYTDGRKWSAFLKLIKGKWDPEDKKPIPKKGATARAMGGLRQLIASNPEYSWLDSLLMKPENHDYIYAKVNEFFVAKGLPNTRRYEDDGTSQFTTEGLENFRRLLLDVSKFPYAGVTDGGLDEEGDPIMIDIAAELGNMRFDQPFFEEFQGFIKQLGTDIGLDEVQLEKINEVFVEYLQGDRDNRLQLSTEQLDVKYKFKRNEDGTVEPLEGTVTANPVPIYEGVESMKEELGISDDNPLDNPLIEAEVNAAREKLIEAGIDPENIPEGILTGDDAVDKADKYIASLAAEGEPEQLPRMSKKARELLEKYNFDPDDLPDEAQGIDLSDASRVWDFLRSQNLVEQAEGATPLSPPEIDRRVEANEEAGRNPNTLLGPFAVPDEDSPEIISRRDGEFNPAAVARAEGVAEQPADTIHHTFYDKQGKPFLALVGPDGNVALSFVDDNGSPIRPVDLDKYKLLLDTVFPSVESMEGKNLIEILNMQMGVEETPFKDIKAEMDEYQRIIDVTPIQEGDKEAETFVKGIKHLRREALSPEAQKVLRVLDHKLGVDWEWNSEWNMLDKYEPDSPFGMFTDLMGDSATVTSKLKDINNQNLNNEKPVLPTPDELNSMKQTIQKNHNILYPGQLPIETEILDNLSDEEIQKKHDELNGEMDNHKATKADLKNRQDAQQAWQRLTGQPPTPEMAANDLMQYGKELYAFNAIYGKTLDKDGKPIIPEEIMKMLPQMLEAFQGHEKFNQEQFTTEMQDLVQRLQNTTDDTAGSHADIFREFVQEGADAQNERRQAYQRFEALVQGHDIDMVGEEDEAPFLPSHQHDEETMAAWKNLHDEKINYNNLNEWERVADAKQGNQFHINSILTLEEQLRERGVTDEQLEILGQTTAERNQMGLNGDGMPVDLEGNVIAFEGYEDYDYNPHLHAWVHKDRFGLHQGMLDESTNDAILYGDASLVIDRETQEPIIRPISTPTERHPEGSPLLTEEEGKFGSILIRRDGTIIPLNTGNNTVPEEAYYREDMNSIVASHQIGSDMDVNAANYGDQEGFGVVSFNTENGVLQSQSPENLENVGAVEVNRTPEPSKKPLEGIGGAAARFLQTMESRKKPSDIAPNVLARASAVRSLKNMARSFLNTPFGLINFGGFGGIIPKSNQDIFVEGMNRYAQQRYDQEKLLHDNKDLLDSVLNPQVNRDKRQQILDHYKIDETHPQFDVLNEHLKDPKNIDREHSKIANELLQTTTEPTAQEKFKEHQAQEKLRQATEERPRPRIIYPSEEKGSMPSSVEQFVEEYAPPNTGTDIVPPSKPGEQGQLV